MSPDLFADVSVLVKVMNTWFDGGRSFLHRFPFLKFGTFSIWLDVLDTVETDFQKKQKQDISNDFPVLMCIYSNHYWCILHDYVLILVCDRFSEGKKPAESAKRIIKMLHRGETIPPLDKQAVLVANSHSGPTRSTCVSIKRMLRVAKEVHALCKTLID